MRTHSQKPRIVVMGGGTGTHTVLSGLKQYKNQVELTAVVAMTDTGGSTGRLRDEFGYLPVGDVRMALVALAAEDDTHEGLLRKLFLHRFDKGHGLAGHNVGNLLLVALTDILGNEAEAIRAAGKVLRVCGEVLPVSTMHTHLVATYEDAVVVTGEHNIDEPTPDRKGRRITALTLSETAHITPEANDAIRNADLIILGPGDLYTSILANCVVDGVREAIQASRGQFLYVGNLMTKMGQTDGMSLAEHIAEVEKYVGRAPEQVYVNTTPLPNDLLARYAKENEFPVQISHESKWASRYMAGDFLMREVVTTKEGDVLRRSLIRHDPKKLADVIMQSPAIILARMGV